MEYDYRRYDYEDGSTFKSGLQAMKEYIAASSNSTEIRQLITEKSEEIKETVIGYAPSMSNVAKKCDVEGAKQEILEFVKDRTHRIHHDLCRIHEDIHEHMDFTKMKFEDLNEQVQATNTKLDNGFNLGTFSMRD